MVLMHFLLHRLQLSMPVLLPWFVLNKKFSTVIDHAIDNVKEIQVALFILMAAYAMAESFMSTGVGASLILIALKVGITAKTVAVVGAIVTSILSIATGTSWGTFAALCTYLLVV